MLFAGQNTVQFSGANYSPEAFLYGSPYADYVDEVIYQSTFNQPIDHVHQSISNRPIDRSTDRPIPIGFHGTGRSPAG